MGFSIMAKARISWSASLLFSSYLTVAGCFCCCFQRTLVALIVMEIWCAVVSLFAFNRYWRILFNLERFFFQIDTCMVYLYRYEYMKYIYECVVTMLFGLKWQPKSLGTALFTEFGRNLYSKLTDLSWHLAFNITRTSQWFSKICGYTRC